MGGRSVVVRGTPGEGGMKAVWGSLIRLICVASSGVAGISLGADPAIERLRLVALDSTARVAVVKLGDERPRAWRVGASIVLSNERMTLRDCADNRAIIEVARPGAPPLTVMITRGETYRVGADHGQSPPRRSSMSPVVHP